MVEVVGGGGKVGEGEMLTEGVGIWVAECQ